MYLAVDQELFAVKRKLLDVIANAECSPKIGINGKEVDAAIFVIKRELVQRNECFL